MRSMDKRRCKGVFGYLDDFLVVADSTDECLLKLYNLIDSFPITLSGIFGERARQFRPRIQTPWEEAGLSQVFGC